MKIICWNVNGLRANVKKGAFDWLVNESPDIFCLQETKARPDQLPDEVVNVPGYHSYFDIPKIKKGYSGVAIYSKVKPERVEYMMGVPELDDEGRLIAAYYKDFVLLTVYFPNGGGGPERLDYKMRFYDAFLKYINKLRKKGLSVIFCGDVNTAHAEIDIARPKENADHTGFLLIERAWIDKIIEHGYVDIWREQNPGKVQYSWWDMKTFARDRNIGWRIDYFLISENLLKKAKKAHILDSVLGSDHCPISLDISL
jgi:exodeoxyribonuclease-3